MVHLPQKWTKNVHTSLLAAPLQSTIETAVKQIALAASLQPATETVETAVKKIVIAATLQPTIKKTVKKIVLAAPLQPATETAVKKIVLAAPLVGHRNSSQRNCDSPCSRPQKNINLNNLR